MTLRFSPLFFAAFCISLPALAGPLEQASITRIINEVQVVAPGQSARAAAVQDVIKEEIGVRTGVKSRAELLFQDQTLTRLGAETFFSFKPGTRDITLDRGTMLLQVPKGLGGAKIRTAAVTASITGTTIMMEHLPGKNLKVVVLEGSLQLSLHGRIGETISLLPGKMIIMRPDARSLPDPVSVDLKSLVKTSALIDPKAFDSGGKGKRTAVAPLPSLGLIEKEIGDQQQRKGRGRLVETNLVILGKGTKVTAASDQLVARLEGAADSRGGLATGDDTISQLLDRRGKGPRRAEGDDKPGRGAPDGKDPQPGDPKPDEPQMPEDPGTPEYPGALLPEILARPDWSAQAGAAAVPAAGKKGPGKSSPTPKPRHKAPALIPSPSTFPIAENTAISLKPKDPTVQLGGGPAAKGSVYGGNSVDVRPSVFLFGAQSNFDAQVALESRFGAPAGGAFPAAGVAVFRFSEIELGASPTARIADGAPTDLALISDSAITSAATGGAWTRTGGLTSLFLGTKNGAITLAQNFSLSAPAASGFNFVHLYSRGAVGTTAVDSTIRLPGGDLFIDAERDVIVGPAAQFTLRRGGFNAGNDASIGGNITAGLLQVEARNTLTWTGSATAERLLGFGSAIEVDGGSLTARDLRLQSSGGLQIGSGGSLAGNAVTLAGNAITADGAINAATLYDGTGGAVNIIAKDSIAVRGTVQIKNNAASATPPPGSNRILLESKKTSGTAIQIDSSAQLLSLLANTKTGAGGTIKFTSAGGDILVNGGTVRAEKGTVDIRNQGAAGTISLNNATLRGDVVKVGALGANGQLLIGGGTIEANTAIKLYAPGSNGTVRFTGDVSLNGRSMKTIAGNTVTIDNSKTVSIGGGKPANVFTNNPNYTGSGGNGSTSGKFGGAGAATKPLSGASGF